MIEELIGKSWVPILQEEFKKEYLINLGNWIAYKRKSFTIYPDKEDVFKAFKLCPYGQVKVVILGQDPYYNGQADGLAFSYKDGIPINNRKQSLDVIYTEIEQDIYNGFYLDKDFDLTRWSKQGVLLLNAVLTVQRNKPDSHAGKGWEIFTDRVIISQVEEKSPKVFMLWGSKSKEVFWECVGNNLLDTRNHLILEALHPASDIRNYGQYNTESHFPNSFLGCEHFSKCNKFLEANNLTKITW